MQNLLTIILAALNFAPGYKTKIGAVALVAVAAGSAYNGFIVPQFGLPAIPGDWLTAAGVAGNAVLGVGIANKASVK